MTSLFKFTSLATVVLTLGVFSTVNGEVATKSFKHGVIVSSEAGSKFKFKKRDASAGLGVANMCTGLLDGIAQTSDQGGEITEEDLQGLYQDYLQEQKRLRTGKYGNMAESAGIVRGALLQSIAENPMVKGELMTQADQCLADMFEPACLPVGFACYPPFEDNCCNTCIWLGFGVGVCS